MALLMFSQALAGALLLSFSETIFTNSLKRLIAEYASSVDPETVIAAGGTAFRTMFAGAELQGMLLAYAKSVDRVLYLAVGAAVGAIAFGCFMGWNDIRKKKQIEKV